MLPVENPMLLAIGVMTASLIQILDIDHRQCRDPAHADRRWGQPRTRSAGC